MASLSVGCRCRRSILCQPESPAGFPSRSHDAAGQDQSVPSYAVKCNFHSVRVNWVHIEIRLNTVKSPNTCFAAQF